MTQGIVEFKDWEKLDLRVAQIKEVALLSVPTKF
jgi:hypothetical protein